MFVKLAEDLPEEYQIVIVGIDEREKNKLPETIISITRTNNQKELAEIYSVADVFVNPTREENFPTTNIEALACGTGVITYRTGGSPEIIDQETGVVVEKDNYDELKQAIFKVKKDGTFSKEKCRNRSMKYSRDEKYKEYVELFESILEGR